MNLVSEKETISGLEKALRQERKRCTLLSNELAKYKELLFRQNAEKEVEEECITNRLCKQVSELIKEKERIALEAEREGEFLTNALQRQVHTLRQEKVNLENQLEQEQEFATNRLQKKLSELQKEKQNLERKLEAETCSHLLELEAYLEKLNRCCDSCCRNQQLFKNEEAKSKISCPCREIVDELSRDVEQKKVHESARTRMFFSELEKLKDENFLLKQRVNAEREKRAAVESEKAKHVQNQEQVDEKMFNTLGISNSDIMKDHNRNSSSSSLSQYLMKGKGVPEDKGQRIE